MREFTGVSYHRQSKISEQIDAEKTPAELANGVLFGDSKSGIGQTEKD